jgi:CubicO group peptidase (beta-lactamase class C family)
MVESVRTELDVESLEATAEELLADPGSPGASVAVVDGAEEVYAAGFGSRRLDPEQPATPETLYGIGSSTKPVTATAVLTLVESGALSLDDAVAAHVPYFADAPGEPITVRELLSHTSGLPSDDTATITLLDGILGDEAGDVAPSLDGWAEIRDYVDGAADRRLCDEERCLYYNSGYVVLSRLVETVADEPFADYVRAAVLEPLGMARSTFDVDVLDDEEADAMTPYREDEEGPQPASLPDDPLIVGPGGLQAPVTEAAAFAGGWADGDLPIGADLAEDATTPNGTFRELLDGSEVGYGYGWMTRPFGDDTLVGHGGGTGVSAGYVGFLAERGLGVALGFNAQPGESPERLACELLAAATGTDIERVLPRRAVEQKERRVTGEYEAYGGLQTATVTRGDDLLELEHASPMGSETELLSATSLSPDDYTFEIHGRRGVRATAEFLVDDDGIDLLVDRALFERVGDVEDGDDEGGENRDDEDAESDGA